MLPLHGLILSNDPMDAAKLCVSAGSAMSENQLGTISLDAGISCGVESLDTGTTLAANTPYHVFIAECSTGGVKAFWSTSPTNPVMPSCYSLRRRIGAFLTDGSANIIKAQWRADGSVQLANSIVVVLTRPLDFISLLTLPVPAGIKVKAKLQLVLFNGGGTDVGFYGICRDPDSGAPPNDGTLGFYGAAWRPNGLVEVAFTEEFTSAAGQIYTGSYPSSANNKMHVILHGWTDYRDEWL